MQAQNVVNGSAPVFAAPTASDTVPIGSVLIVKNGSASAVTVTVVTPGNLATGDAFPDKTFSVAASGEAWIRVNLAAYRDTTDSAVARVTFSAVASVTAAAVAL